MGRDASKINVTVASHWQCVTDFATSTYRDIRAQRPMKSYEVSSTGHTEWKQTCLYYPSVQLSTVILPSNCQRPEYFFHKKLFSWALLRTFSTCEHHLEPVLARYRYCVYRELSFYSARSWSFCRYICLSALTVAITSTLLKVSASHHCECVYHLSYHHRAFFYHAKCWRISPPAIW